MSPPPRIAITYHSTQYSSLLRLLGVIVAASISLTSCGQPAPPDTNIHRPVAPTKDNDLQAIKARGHLIVSVRMEESPMGAFRDPAHIQKRDYEVSLARAIAKRLLGSEQYLELQMPRVPDRIPALHRREVDLALSTIPITEDLKQQVDFSAAYAVGGLAAMTRPGSGIASVAELGGTTVAVPRVGERDAAAELQQAAMTRGLALSIMRAPTFEAAVMALEAEQVSAVVANIIELQVYTTQRPGMFVLADGLLTREAYGIAIGKGNDDLLRFVNQVLGELRQSGELEQLADRAMFPLGLE